MQAQTWKVQSKSSPDQVHTVTQDPVTGELTCTCKGFEYRSKCSHIDKVAQLLNKKGDKYEQKHKD